MGGVPWPTCVGKAENFTMTPKKFYFWEGNAYLQTIRIRQKAFGDDQRFVRVSATYNDVVYHIDTGFFSVLGKSYVSFF